MVDDGGDYLWKITRNKITNHHSRPEQFGCTSVRSRAHAVQRVCRDLSERRTVNSGEIEDEQWAFIGEKNSVYDDGDDSWWPQVTLLILMKMLIIFIFPPIALYPSSFSSYSISYTRPPLVSSASCLPVRFRWFSFIYSLIFADSFQQEYCTWYFGRGQAERRIRDVMVFMLLCFHFCFGLFTF